MKYKRTITAASVLIVLAFIMVTVALKSEETAGKVKITIRCSPENAEVSIMSGDGSLVKPEDSAGRNYSLKPGEYTYSAKYDGYVTIESYYFKVENGKEQTLTIELIPLEDAFFESHDTVIENQDMYQDYLDMIGKEEQ